MYTNYRKQLPSWVCHSIVSPASVNQCHVGAWKRVPASLKNQWKK